MSPSGSLHAIIAATLAEILCDFVKPRKLGWVFGAEGGFHIHHDPDTVRAPDVAFVSTERMPASVPLGFFPGPPDLAVEILSPSDRASEVIAKVQEWLHAGCRAVWVVDPETETITVHESKERIFELSKLDSLSGGEVLPHRIARPTA